MIAVLSRRRSGPLVVFLAALTMYAASATWTGAVIWDVLGTSLEAWRWAMTGSPWLEGLPSDRLVVMGEAVPNWMFIEAGGHVVSTRTIGVVGAAFPAYLLFGLAEHTLWPSTLVAVLLSSSAVAFMFCALRRLVPVAVAGAATAVFAVATPTWSVSADALFTHSLTQAAIAAAAWAAAANSWWLAGVALGAGITGRAHLGIIAAALGLGVAWARRSPRIAFAVGLPAAVGLAVVVLSNGWRYGQLSVSGGYSSYAEANLTSVGAGAVERYLVNVAGFLISPDRGLLLWTPLLLIMLPAAVRVVRLAPSWVASLSAGGILYTLVQLKINHFGGGDSFYAYRLGLELLTCLVPLYALAWCAIRDKIMAVAVVVFVWLQFLMISVGAIVTRIWVIDDDVWRDNAFAMSIRDHTVVVLVLTGVAAIGVFLSLPRVLRFLPDGPAEVHPPHGPREPAPEEVPRSVGQRTSEESSRARNQA